ncbi:hypothetical protein [Shinella sp.]|uniref:hypothetical protein n=1 Tax=Shinella sp. TaxID=1870904 RepID=UPI0029A9FEFC|nr:hypothetical protein [Shinella sp.]MDX3976572.1 hypothetical protein [Shinella sp.]
MDIKTFVSEALIQVLEGIREAQSREGGHEVGAVGYGIKADGGRLIDGGTSGVFTTVDFDISVVAETSEGGGTVRVADTQIADGSSKMSQNASRMKFAVHLRLPKGGPLREDF